MNRQRHPRIAAVAALILSVSALAACASEDDERGIKADRGAPSEISQDLIDKATAEGKVVIYGNPPEDLWNRLIPAFEELYPGISIETVDLAGPELVQRYLSEVRTGSAAADLIIDSSGSTILELAPEVATRISTFDDGLPDFANPADGIYAIAADPSVMLYNKVLLAEDERPETLADMARLAETYPEKLTTYATTSDNGYSQMWAFAEALGEEAWDLFATLAPATRYESSGGTMVQKLSQGEYVGAYFQSGLVRGLLEPSGYADIIGWAYPADGTPVQPRYAAVMKEAAHPNAAALLQDYLLSTEGQTVVCASGLTAVRDDVVETCGDFSLTHIIDELGEENVHIIPADMKVYDAKPKFEARLQDLTGN